MNLWLHLLPTLRGEWHVGAAAKNLATFASPMTQEINGSFLHINHSTSSKITAAVSRGFWRNETPPKTCPGT